MPRRRIGHDDELMRRRRLRGSRVQAVRAQRSARQLGRDRVLRRRSERGERADATGGREAGDGTAERHQRGGREEAGAMTRAQIVSSGVWARSRARSMRLSRVPPRAGYGPASDVPVTFDPTVIQDLNALSARTPSWVC